MFIFYPDKQKYKAGFIFKGLKQEPLASALELNPVLWPLGLQFKIKSTTGFNFAKFANIWLFDSENSVQLELVPNVLTSCCLSALRCSRSVSRQEEMCPLNCWGNQKRNNTATYTTQVLQLHSLSAPLHQRQQASAGLCQVAKTAFTSSFVFSSQWKLTFTLNPIVFV